MNTLTETVKAKNNRAKIIYAALIALTALSIILAVVIESRQTVFLFISIFFFASSLMILKKYIFSEYIYEINYDESLRPVFMIKERMGKKITVHCRMDLYAITGVCGQNTEQRKAHKAQAGAIRYTYVPTMNAEKTYLITVNARYQNTEIRIECSDEFARALNESSKIARENYLEDDE